MIKHLKNIILSISILLISTGIFFQVKVEQYKKQLIEVYDFDYLKKKRKSYIPFVVFFLYSKLFKKNKCYFINIYLPYNEYEKKNNIVRKPNESYEMIFNIENNAYLMYCYYDLKELNCHKK